MDFLKKAKKQVKGAVEDAQVHTVSISSSGNSSHMINRVNSNMSSINHNINSSLIKQASNNRPDQLG